MPHHAEAFERYVASAANTTQHPSAMQKSKNVQDAKENTRPGTTNAQTRSKQSKTSLLINDKHQLTLMNNQDMCRRTQTIGVLQYNLNKSRTTTDTVLNSPSSSKYAILLLQEQYFSKYTNLSLTHQSWTLIESTKMDNNPPRAAIYLNKTILPPHSYELIQIEIPDIVTIALRLDQEQHPTLIVNIYNTKNSTQLRDLRTHLRRHLRDNQYNGIIIAGDFNLHHPLWNPPGYHTHDPEADILIDIMSQLKLNPLLPAGTITFPRAKTSIDLVWGNEYAEQRIIKCRAATDHDHDSDHYPVETILNLHPCPYGPEAQQPYNYNKTNWKIFEQKLKDYLPTLNHAIIPTAETVDQMAEDITTAIRKAIAETTPRAKICPFSKRWWHKDIENLRKQIQLIQLQKNA